MLATIMALQQTEIMNKKLKHQSQDTMRHITSGVCGNYHTPEPSIQIKQHTHFQKFRHDGENRPGMKNHSKQFMTVQLSNLQGKMVRLIMCCVDAESTFDNLLIHPNGLVGKDCQDGIYDKVFSISSSHKIYNHEIPYIHIERMKTRKSNMEKNDTILRNRVSFLPSPWKDRFLAQCKMSLWSSKIDTSKVRLAVIVTVETSPGQLDKPLLAVSDIVKNGSQNTSLAIFKISSISVSATTGGYIDIFMTENSPPIEPGKYKVYVTHKPSSHKQKLEYWTSEESWLTDRCILYKKVISYKVPPFQPNVAGRIEAILNLECPESMLHCTFPFFYVSDGAESIDTEMFDDFGLPMEAAGDEGRSTKIIKHELSENEDLTSALIENIKMKPYSYQGDVDDIVTTGSDTKPELKETRQISDHHDHKSKYLHSTPRQSLQEMNRFACNLFSLSNIPTDGEIDNQNWLEQLLGNQEIDNNPTCRATFRADNIQHSKIQDGVSSSLKRRATQISNLAQLPPNYKESYTSNLPTTEGMNPSHKRHKFEPAYLQNSAIEDVKPLLSNQNYWDGNYPRHTQNDVSQNFSAVTNNFLQHFSASQASTAINKTNVTEHTGHNRSADTVNLPSLDQLSFDELIPANLRTADWSQLLNDSLIYTSI